MSCDKPPPPRSVGERSQMAVRVNYDHWLRDHFSYSETHKVINQSGRKTIMLHLNQVDGERVDEPCHPGAALMGLPNDRATSSTKTDRQDVRTSSPAETGSVCLCRLARLAPQLANELLSSWSDPHLAGRLIEEVLGGEREVNLETEAIIELVRLYEYLEDVRTVGTADKATGSNMTSAQLRCCSQSSQV